MMYNILRAFIDFCKDDFHLNFIQLRLPPQSKQGKISDKLSIYDCMLHVWFTVYTAFADLCNV